MTPGPVDDATLAAVAAAALGAAGQVRVVNWVSRQIFAGDGRGLGVYRFDGTASHEIETVPWSAVLKVLGRSGNDDDERGWDYWRREALAYRSGLLAHVPGGLAAPRLLHASEGVGGRQQLWLEAVEEEIGPRWPLSRYGLGARHLGQFNGTYLVGRPLPTVSWLARGWLRSWVEAARDSVAALPAALEYPLVARVYPPNVADSIARLWRDREQWLTALDRLPHTLCHQDAFRRNLIARDRPGGETQTVALDWAFVGIGPLGSELAPLIQASVAFLEVAPADADGLEQLCMDGYVAGLADAGWAADPALARLGYALSSLLRYPLGCVRLLLPALLDTRLHAGIEQTLGRPFDEIVDHWRTITGGHLALADQARALLAAAR
jgi:Phosphotransferase enzyme family